MSNFQFPILIKTNHELRLFAHYAMGKELLAVDTEFLRERTYYPLLCLIQLGTEEVQVALDPFTITDFSPLTELLTAPHIVKIFHAAEQDLEIIYQEFSCLPYPFFDTQIAHAFLSTVRQISYAGAVEHYCSQTLVKGESLSDWSIRPLDSYQLRYALDDVRYLPSVYKQQVALLNKLGRLSWPMTEFEPFLQVEHYERDPRKAYQKLKRLTTLRSSQLPVAREIAAWREKSAASRNIVRRSVLADEVVVELSRKQPKDFDSLRRMRGLDKLSMRDLHEVLDAIRIGRQSTIAPEELEVFHKRERGGKDLDAVADLMQTLLRLISEREKICTQYLASRDELIDLARGNHGCSPLMQGWRRDLVGDMMMRLLTGKLGLTVSEGQIEFLM